MTTPDKLSTTLTARNAARIEVAKCGVHGCDQPGTARNGLCRDCAYEGDCDSQAARREDHQRDE